MKRVVPGLAEVVLSYDTRGRLVGTTQGEGLDARSMSLSYFGSGPSQGYLESLTDALGRTVEYDYDLAGCVIRKTLPDGWQVRYEYDGNGNLTALHPPGQPPHLFDYTASIWKPLTRPPTSARAIRLRGMGTTAIRISCPSPGPMDRAG